MDAGKLAEAMRIGSASDYESNALGKYGYGLKGASWSQAKVFTVVSKRDGGPAHHLTWDVDDMADWIAKSDPLDPFDTQATVVARHGTVVLWKDMRPPESVPATRDLDPYSAEVMLLERHLALVFHRFLEGKAAGRKPVAILINGKPVEPNNPVGYPLASPYDLKTVRIPTETGDGKVQIQAWLLPSEEEITNYEKPRGPEAARRALDLIGLHGKRNETQGLFIYRHDRLIKWGGWHQMWDTNDEKTKLARVVVNFDSKLDDALKINISKQLVQLPQQLQAEIKKLADPVRRESQKKYRKSSASVSPAQPAGKASIPYPKSVPHQGAVADPTGIARGRPEQPPQIAVKAVKTEKFIWKVTRGITGALDLQVSDLNPSLAALAKQINDNASAVAHLAAFLDGLDQAGVQKSLLAGKGA
jgi:Histidine kinase-, DNA gyrase B-, and HSP90-like ATPase